MTIKDLARLSGYSLGTVSRVLNNQPNVSEQGARNAILAHCRGTAALSSTQARSCSSSSAPTRVLIIVKGTANEMFASDGRAAAVPVFAHDASADCRLHR